MDEKQFINWLRGFTQGVHHYNVTPKQWDYLKKVLSEVYTEQNNNYLINPEVWTTDIS